MIYVIMYHLNRIILNTHKANDLVMLCCLRKNKDCEVIKSIEIQGQYMLRATEMKAMKVLRKILGCSMRVLTRDYSTTIEFTFNSPKELITAPDLIKEYLPRGSVRFSSCANKINVFFPIKDL